MFYMLSAGALDPPQVELLEVADIIFTIVFDIEMILKVVGLGAFPWHSSSPRESPQLSRPSLKMTAPAQSPP